MTTTATDADTIQPPKDIPFHLLETRTLTFNDGTRKDIPTGNLSASYEIGNTTLEAFIATPVRADRSSTLLFKLTTEYVWRVNRQVEATSIVWLDKSMRVVDIEAYKITDQSLSSPIITGIFEEVKRLRADQGVFADLQKKINHHGSYDQLLEANARLRAAASDHTRREYDLKNEVSKHQNTIAAAEDRLREANLQRDKAISDARLLQTKVGDLERFNASQNEQIIRLEDILEERTQQRDIERARKLEVNPVAAPLSADPSPNLPAFNIIGNKTVITVNVFKGDSFHGEPPQD